MSISRKIVYNVAFSSTAKILSTATALVGIGLITRHLGQDGFGLYATALAFLAFFGALGDWGLPQTTAMRIAKPKVDEKRIISNMIGLRIFISIAILIITPIIAPFLPYPYELKIAIVIVAAAYVLSSSYQILTGMFQKRLMMDRVTGAELAGKIIQVGLIAWGVYHNWSFFMIVSTLFINMLLNFLFVYLFSRKFIKFKPAFEFNYWKDILKQSIPLGLATALTFVYFRSSTILLSMLRPPEDVGIFGAAQKVIENISFFPAMIVGLTMPLFSHYISKDKEKFKFLVNQNYKIFFILTVPLLIGGTLLSDKIILLIAGEEFIKSIPVLQVNLIALVLIFFGTLFMNIMIAAKLEKSIFWALLICAVVSVAGNLIFIPLFPNIAYMIPAVISVITEALVVFLTGLFIWKKLSFFPRVEKFFRIVVAGSLMGIAIYFLKDLNFFVLVLLGMLIYGISLIVLKIISKEELLLLLKKPK
jgi:O-antigen/teichoic acid export membrane protein